MDKLFSGKYCDLVLLLQQAMGRRQEEVPTGSLGLQERSQSAPRCQLIGSQTPRQ